MIPYFTTFEKLSSTSSLLLILLFTSSYSIVSPQDLPPPENPSFAQEQFLLNPFKTSFNQALTCGQLIASRGFKFERHFVTTKDGYILQLFRIINPYAQQARGRNLKPILVIHGGAVSCSSWMINGRGGHIKEWINGNPPPDSSDSLAFALANREFDPWFGNFRGTTYSQNHTRLNPDEDDEFWDFSFKELGEYDIPAMVDYIIQETGHDKVVYVGYSLSTIAMLTLLSKQPEFACKLDLNILISPIAFWGDIKGVGALLRSPEVKNLTEYLSVKKGPVIPALPFVDATLSILCTADILKPVCFEIVNYIFGPDRVMISPDQVKVLVSQLDQVSIKVGLHVVQSIYYDQIREFDYGPEINLDRYGSIEPPKFPFENVPTYNLVLISHLNDYPAPPESVQKLRNILEARAFIDRITTWPDWNHIDVLLADQAFEFIHSVIIDIIRTNGNNEEICLDHIFNSTDYSQCLSLKKSFRH